MTLNHFQGHLYNVSRYITHISCKKPFQKTIANNHCKSYHCKNNWEKQTIKVAKEVLIQPVGSVKKSKTAIQNSKNAYSLHASLTNHKRKDSMQGIRIWTKLKDTFFFYARLYIVTFTFFTTSTGFQGAYSPCFT